MTKILKYLILFIIVLAVSSCQKEESLRPESVVIVEDVHESEFDKWLYENFTKPYNIQVKWKWDDNEVDNTFHVIPPIKQQAEYFAKALLEIWIKPYEAEAGPEFVKRYTPKLIYLLGTPQFNDDGSMTVGLAEGGRKVTVFDVNRFDPTNLVNMSKHLHTMHHEFAHILHQKVLFSNDYKDISKGAYTGAWINVGAVDANALGFITPYSMSKDVEDWVEIVATMLTHVEHSNTPISVEAPLYDENGKIQYNTDGKMIRTIKKLSQWEGLIDGIGVYRDATLNKYVQHPQGPEGKNKIRKKVGIIKDYYKSVWQMDLTRLQKRIETASLKFIEEKKEEDE